MKSESGISIITATYNASDYLSRLIESLRSQSNQDFEWIVIDGASSDNTVELIKQAEDTVSIWVSEPDYGIYHAMNKGIELAKGDYILFLGADDVLYPDAIKEIKAWIKEQPELPDFVVSPVFVSGRVISGYRPHLTWLGHRACVTHHSVGMLVKRSIMKELGGFSLAYKQCADGLMIKRLIKEGYKGVESNILMGEFCEDGVSNCNRARGLAEGYLVQLETGELPLLQYVIYMLRMLKNLVRLIR